MEVCVSTASYVRPSFTIRKELQPFKSGHLLIRSREVEPHSLAVIASACAIYMTTSVSRYLLMNRNQIACDNRLSIDVCLAISIGG